MSDSPAAAAAPEEPTPRDESVPSPEAQTTGTDEAPQPAPAPEEDVDDGREVQKIPGELFRHMVGMGFSENGVKKSIIAGCINEDTCLQWLQMHQGHPELDTEVDPNIRVVIVEKKDLTPEELAAKVEEMKRKIALKKKQDSEEEAGQERHREKHRVEEGRMMREMKEEREKKLRMEAYEEMRKQKAADAAAREKIQLEITIDKKVRQGLDPETARAEAIKEMEEKKKTIEEETKRRAEERQREREQMEKRRDETGSGGASGWNLASLVQDAPSSQDAPSVPAAKAAPVVPAAPEPNEEEVATRPTQETFQYIIARMQGAASTGKVDGTLMNQSLSTLKLIVGNIVKHPMDIKFRTLKRSTGVFTKKIAPVPHAVEFLMTCGFRSETTEEEGKALVMRTLLFHRLQAASLALTGAGVQ